MNITKLLNKQGSYSGTMEIFTNTCSYFPRSAYDSGTCSNFHTSPVSGNVSLNYRYSKEGCTSRFLGSFTTLRKSTISFFMFVCPSVRTEQLFSLGRISMKFDTWVFSNIWRENSSFIRTKGTLQENQSTFLIISLSILLRMRNVSEKVVKKMKTHFVYIIKYLGDNVEKHWKARHGTHYNMPHAHCVLDS